MVEELVSYLYGGTNQGAQQTRKQVRDGTNTLETETVNSYDLQGRLLSSIETSFGPDGQGVARRETTSFDYDHTGIRVSSWNKVETVNAETGNLAVFHELSTTYLVDHSNFTGYQQVVREEMTNVVTGAAEREVGYTVGHDVIGQWSDAEIPRRHRG